MKALLGKRKVVLAGYGREGRSTHALLNRLCPDTEVVVADGNDEIQASLARDFDLVVKSPGVPMSVLNGRCPYSKITSQSDIFLQVYADRTIGVTGTKGKSTTATLINHILSRNGLKTILAGNIGIPLLDIVPEMDADTVVVAELSCHQLEAIGRAPHVAVLLNLFEEHLDHYRDYLDYQMAKMQIGLKQREGDHFFYSADNADLVARVAENRKDFKSELTPFSIDMAETSPVAAMPSPLQGRHNLSNAYVAKLVTALYGIDDDHFAAALASFAPLEHRMELVGTYGGVTYYNDSISTIPAACIAAVQSLPNVETLIVGGFDRGIDYQPLADFLAASTVRNIAFVGRAGERMASLLPPEALNRINHIFANDYGQIVRWCAEVTRRGASCLLSPAAASYDAFKNFEQRGTIFKQLVRSLQQ